jgi:hypothetical protein
MAIDLQKRSFIRNMCPWGVGFHLPISKASVTLGGYQKTSINNEELIALVENSNVMFAGTGNGNHARIYIENDELRKFVGYDSEDGKIKQFILTDEECQKILDYKTIVTFRKHLEEDVVCNHEKTRIMEYARRAKLNDYEKIILLEQHCGMKFKLE